MIFNRTRRILLATIGIGSELLLLPFHWDESKEKLVPSRARVQLAWKLIMIIHLVAKCFLVTLIMSNILVLVPQMPVLEKVAGLCLASYLVLYIAVNAAVYKDADFIRVILNAHFQLLATKGKFWHIDPGERDGLELLFGFICASALGFVFAGYPSTFFLYQTTPDMISTFGSNNLAVRSIPGFIILLGYWPDALFLAVLLMFVVTHYHYTLRWLRRIRWTPHCTHKQKSHVATYYHSLQVLHQYFTEETKFMFPSNVILIAAMLNGFLYRLIAYYHTIPVLPMISPVILFLLCFYTFVLKKYADGANAVMIASRDVGCSFTRSQPRRTRKLARHVFNSLKPLKTGFLGFFILSKSTFMLSIRFAVIDSVIFLLLTFRGTVEK